MIVKETYEFEFENENDKIKFVRELNEISYIIKSYKKITK